MNVLFTAPFNLTATGRPSESNTSMRPVAVVVPVLISAISVAQPPPKANWGKRPHPAPPTMPAVGVSATAPTLSDRIGITEVVGAVAGAVALNVAPVNANPSGANGTALCRLILPINDGPVKSAGKSSPTNWASWLYGAIARVIGAPTTVPFSSLSVRVTVFV